MEPFELPADLSALSADELAELNAKIQAHLSAVTQADPPASLEILRDAKNAYTAIAGEVETRDAAATAAANDAAEAEALLQELSTAAAPAPAAPAETAPVVTETAPAVVASGGAPAILQRSTIDPAAPGSASGAPAVRMVTAPDVPGFPSGMALESFSQAAIAIDARLQNLPTSSAPDHGRLGPTPLTKHSFAINPSRSALRQNAIMFKREFPKELRIESGDGMRAQSVVRYASKESRLPGGSLIESAKALVKAGRPLTAAVGWCAPSEVIYNLCDLASLDGMLDLPEVQAARGGFQLPANGGPDFSVVWNGIGDDGDVVLTEYDVENGAIKECFEIPCPPFTDVRLDVAYLCLTGSLLQRRGYPEVVEWFSQESIKALAHKVNASVISRIVTASGAPVVIPPIAYSDDAASALLSAIDLAIEDIKYRQRMSRAVTLEVVLPYWALTQVRAALARRRGILALDVTDNMIMDWFAVRNAMPRFVYDWQDAYTGGNGGGRPGGSTPITALPTTVNFLVYPAGTWTKIVRDVVNLDTIYDNALLTTNNYTALFAEDGFNVIQTCPVSRVYTATVNPDGVVGCCDS